MDDWASILTGIITVLLFAVGLPLALRKRKKGASQNVEQLLRHLENVGVKVSSVEKGSAEEKVGVRRSFSQRSEGVIKIEDNHIDYVNISSVTSQYGVNYFLDYLVESAGWAGQRKRKKTRMVRRKSPPLWGRLVDIAWRGDDYLSQQLNLDYQLKDMLQQAGISKLKTGIEIVPEPKHKYTRIRTAYLLPSPDLFRAIEIIANYIKSGY